jgi:1-acyl-sn-glycerol-3-phosphate acyltransferase
VTSRPKPKHRFYVASILRQALWSLVAYMLGGVTITGRVPKKPGIVVVNHSSHADTAVLFSVLNWMSKPFVVAAADYWGNGPKRFIANSVVATVLVERTGGADSYEALRATVEERLNLGELVILFPEGTRTNSGEVGEFKSGAVRLASDLQVRLYPTALKGLHKLFPKHGRLSPRRMEIVFGEPLVVPANLDREAVKDISAQVREKVVALKSQDTPVLRLQHPFR